LDENPNQNEATEIQSGDIQQGARRRSMPKWVLIVSPLAIAAVVAIAAILMIPKPDEVYLSKLSEQGLGGIYASDAQAIAAGNAECRRLNDGGDPSGTQEKFIAVEVYCKDFAAGYRVLQEIKVIGTMTVYDDKILMSGSNCYISDRSGYDDMREGKEVVILNAKGERLTTSSFGPGDGVRGLYCSFEFAFTVLEGEREYIVEIGRRGSVSYSESELKTPGSVALSLG
jgi:hypothetical protein